MLEHGEQRSLLLLKVMKRKRNPCHRTHGLVNLVVGISVCLWNSVSSLSLVPVPPLSLRTRRHRTRESFSCFLKSDGFSDHFFDEADELLSFVDMLDDEHEHDYMIQSSDDSTSKSSRMVPDSTDAVETRQGSKKSSDSPIDIGDSQSHELDGSNSDHMDNIIVPDLNTLLANMQLAPASEIAYFYLQNTLVLEPEVMWKITNTAGSVLGFTVQNLERKINLWKRMMNLSDEDVRQIITKQPSILHLSANRNISPTVLFLVRGLDLSKDELRQVVVAYPCILCYSIENLARKIDFFKKTLGMEMGAARELLLSEPKLLTAGVQTGLIPRFNFLHKEIQIPLVALQKIVQKNPRLLLYSLRDNLQPKLVSFFIMKLHMDPRHVLDLLSTYPLIMDYNLDNHMLPIARYFISELDFSPIEVRRILLKFPRLMTHSLSKIKHVVGYLRYQLGMDANEVRRILYQAPQVVSLNTDDTLVSKVTFLQGFFNLDNEKSLRKVIAGMPTLLLCNVEKNLEPKAQYLLDRFGDDEFELRQAILTLPTLLGYSLEKRIRPRMERILEIGLEPIKITVGITMTNDNFERWLQNKQWRIENGGKLIDKGRPSQREVISQQHVDDDLDSQQRSGRIVHWKR